MTNLVSWFEAHDKLAGWAQFLGAMLALGVTYFTAFAPTWRRKRQLQSSADRLLANGCEVLESYHRTSANFLPFPASVRLASLTVLSVADEISRFPIFDLDNNHRAMSLSRKLNAMKMNMESVRMFLDGVAEELETHASTEEDQAHIRKFIEERLEFSRALVAGAELKRPEWPTPEADA